MLYTAGMQGGILLRSGNALEVVGTGNRSARYETEVVIKDLPLQKVLH